MASDFIKQVEPFVDMDIRAMRRRYMSEELAEQARLLLQRRLGGSEMLNAPVLLEILAELVVDIHLLQAAYVETQRYKDPGPPSPMPPATEASAPDAVEVDLRADITGANWWHAEQDGRWAGPENESSVFLPAVRPGRYNLQITVADEIAPGILDGTTCTFDRQVVTLARDGESMPATLHATVEVPADHRWPFHAIKLRFPSLHSPQEFGRDDARKLAIRVGRIALAPPAA